VYLVYSLFAAAVAWLFWLAFGRPVFCEACHVPDSTFINVKHTCFRKWLGQL
jgi:hypothetical protein